MLKGLIFFCCAGCILILTIINLSIGPIVNGTIDNNYVDMNGISATGNNGGTLNCAYLSDEYDKLNNINDKADKYVYKWAINECSRRKGLHVMEYMSFIFDIAIGFVCGLLGLFHHFDLKKEFVSKTGLIGLGCGSVGFILTFIYVVYNGIVYTNYYDDRYLLKRDSDLAFAEWKGDHYECYYYDDDNHHAIIAKYSDLINKQYNYDKDLLEEATSGEAFKCQYNSLALLCGYMENLDIYPKTYQDDNGNTKNCKYLYVSYSIHDNTNKDISDRFLTTLILSLFVCLANIGLALFGFLLFRTPGEF